MDKTERLQRAQEVRRRLILEGKFKQLDPVEKWKRDPASLIKSLHAYFWDMEKVLSNRGSPDGAEQRRIAEGLYKAARAASRAPDPERPQRKLGLRRTINKLCIRCVGYDVDRSAPLKIRDCTCRDCPLHRVRPWQDYWAEAPASVEGGSEP